MASITTFPPVSAYDDAAIAARVKGLEDAGFITADDLPEISEAEWSGISGNIADQEDLATALNAKQDTLVSGTNIKTINGETVLGEGDIIIESGGLDESQLKAFLVGLEDGTFSGDEYVVMVNREQDVVTRYSLNDLISTIASLVDTSGGGGGSGLSPKQEALINTIPNKVDAIAGMGLSSNNFTNADREKLSNIQAEATKNRPDVELLNRSNHVGRQDISTINNLQETLDELQTQNDEFVRSQDVKKIVTMTQFDYEYLSYVDPEVLYIIVPQT